MGRKNTMADKTKRDDVKVRREKLARAETTRQVLLWRNCKGKRLEGLSPRNKNELAQMEGSTGTKYTKRGEAMRHSATH